MPAEGLTVKYKTELHCHTKEISPCSGESGAEVAKKYIDHGYTTLVITNHFTEWIANDRVKGETWEEKLAYYYGAVDLVREAAGDRLNVLCGMELRMNGDPNDYLVFGAKPEDFYEIPYVFNLCIRDVHSYLNSRGAIIIQAHPFRFGMQLTHPSFVDGYEIANGHPGHHSHNDLAEAWAKRFVNHDPIMTTGTDEHEPSHVPNGGIMTDAPITSNDELLAVLRSRDYELIRPVLDQDPTL